MEKMFYRTPPKEWMEGLPIGNGRLAAMIWGQDTDHITLNHEWLWTGINRYREVQEAADSLPALRALIEKDEVVKATKMANDLWGGPGGISGTKNRVDAYQPAGEMTFTPDRGAFVSRELNLHTGVVEIQRESGLTASFFVDCLGSCLAVQWKAAAPFSGTLSLFREAEAGTTVTVYAKNGEMGLDGAIAGGTGFAVRILLDTDGEMIPQGDSLRIENATCIHAAVNMATSVCDMQKELAEHIFRPKDFEQIKAAHEAHFRELMGRVEICLEEDDALGTLPTDERIRRVKAGAVDNGISQLYLDYGRYLLISSSVCGELPANLQGKWNDSLTPPWESDYHMDINLEMNYWMAEPSDMPECVNALVRYARSFLESGRKAAKNLYGCRGIFLPIQTDAWGNSTPESYGWAVWIGAAPWIARHLWEHYRYSGDKEYLKNQAYEFFTEVAAFYEDYLQKDENGIYQILPSQSPENPIVGVNYPVPIVKSTAMDVQLCYDALGYAISSAEILGVDEEKAALWREMRDHLPPFAIGSDGRLMEWSRNYEEREPGHRHLSHLYGLYPSDLFTPDTRPEQYDAAIRSLRYRLSHGGGHTGWSRAWVSCISARLGDKEGFYEHFTALIKDFATVSLLDLHPPRIFQIDGNLGAVAAVIEAMVSFYDGTAHLLRGLPEQWKNGRLKGIKLPGGHKVNMAWADGALTHLSVTIGYEAEARLEWQGQNYTAKGQPGETVTLLPA